MDDQERREKKKERYDTEEATLKAEKESLLLGLGELERDPKVREFIRLKSRLRKVTEQLPPEHDDTPFGPLSSD